MESNGMSQYADETLRILTEANALIEGDHFAHISGIMGVAG